MNSVGLTCENLTVGYRHEILLQEVNLSIPEGSLTCVFGRNGVGKSTLLRTICGFQKPLSGDIKWNSIRLEDVSLNDRSRTFSVVLTSRPSISLLSVRDYVSYGRAPYSNWMGKEDPAAHEQIEKALELCGINELSERDINQLSDGELQKVEIARAIAQNTKYIFLDEPASHLDLESKAAIFKLIKYLWKKENKSIVFTSHDLPFAMQLAEEFVVLNDQTLKKYSKTDFVENKIYEEVLSTENFELNAESNSLKYRDIT